MCRLHRTTAIAWATIIAIAAIHAESAYAEIYKLIDKNGHVTYSNEPITGAAIVEGIDSPFKPSEEDVRAIQDEYKRIEALASDMERRRLQREEQQARREMEERMQEAYLRRSQASTFVYEVPVAYPVGLDESWGDRKHFHKSRPTHDHNRPHPTPHRNMGTGMRSPSTGHR